MSFAQRHSAMFGGDDTSRGFTATFVSPPPSELECPICLLLMREPHLTSCCGNHFCSACISEVRSRGEPCPLCKADVMHTLLNRKEKCRITELKVYCSARDSGCEWVGELGDLTSHMAVGKESGPCQFVLVQCRLGCQQDIPRADLTQHTESECPCRLHSCPYCGEEATGKNLASHFESCQHFPVVCPHMCELSSFPRSQLSSHLEACPNQPLPCPFLKTGCKTDLTRRELKDHLQTHLQDHLTMVVDKLEMVETRNRNLEGQLAESEKKADIREDRITHLEQRLMKLEERAANDFDIIPRPTADTGGAGLSDWVTLDKKGSESPPSPDAVEAEKEQRKESGTLDATDSVEADPTERSSLAESFFGLPRARDFVHFFKRGAHHRNHGGWLHRHHRGPFRPPHPDSDEEESPTSSMAGAFCKPPSFLRSQALQCFTLSKSEQSPVLHLRLGNIVADNAEAIVAPCDPFLHHDGGCVGAINVASHGLLQSLCNTHLQRHGKMDTAEAAAFEAGGGRLKCKHVICVVGPHSRQHSLERSQTLLHASCCSVLRVALDLKVTTMAVPSICAGAYGMDPSVCAQILIDTFTDYQYPQDCPLKEIRLVIFDKMVYSKFVEYFVFKQAHVETAKAHPKIPAN